MSVEKLIQTIENRVACPDWPDCADDEGPCFACVQAAAIIAALEDRERLRALIHDLKHELMVSEIGGDEILPAERALLAALESGK